jgi:lipoprotein-anchoring transpeptidase ErfK/SrfK
MPIAGCVAKEFDAPNGQGSRERPENFGDMVRTILFLSALTTGLIASTAIASVPAGDRAPEWSHAMQDDGVLLVAQAGDYEVFYDGRGNRVIIDAYTGKVIAVQPPQTRFNRRALRLRELGRGFDEPPPGSERYYLDDPEDMARLRRRQLEERRFREPEFGAYEDDYGDRAYGTEEDLYPPAPDVGRGFDEAPATRQPSPVAKRKEIQRKPLKEASVQPEKPAEKATEPDAARSRIEPGAVVDPSLSLGAREEVAALQVLLDRVGASPGVIDGRFGSNVDKALAAYAQITGTRLKSTDTAAIKAELERTGGEAFASYTITAEDVAGPFVASVPEDYGAKAKLERLSYTSVTEALAERFHMDEAYLKALNPGLNFNRPGTIVKVANFGRLVSTPVARIVADKGRKQVFAYDQNGKMVAAYPATIGSSDTPSPSGTHTVSRVAFDPNYTYNPKVNFKQGDNDKVLTIPPGPNGPVGSVWIALDRPTYGIHGTPEPSKIGKTESHGCVRLTNWDAAELAKLVKPGVPVEFVD